MATTTDGCTCCKSKGRDTYWRLECKSHTTIAEAKAAMRPFYCPASAKKDRVMALLDRFERGLLSYDRYSKAQLQIFIKARGLPESIPSSTYERETVARLEKADDEATFTRFLDLPPELRVRIYELHMATFKTVRACTQPPISKTSKLIRQEALPMFYQSSRFHFEAIYVGHFADRQASRLPGSPGYCCTMLHRLSDESLSCITRFTLSCSPYIYWHVELSTADGSWTVGLKEFGSANVEEPHLNTRIEEIVKEIAGRDRSRKLIRCDIETLMDVVII